MTVWYAYQTVIWYAYQTVIYTEDAQSTKYKVTYVRTGTK